MPKLKVKTKLKKSVGKKTVSKESKLVKQEKKISKSKKELKSSKQKNSPDQNSKTKKIADPQTMEELLATTGYNLKGVKKGDVTEGVIASVNPREITIDIGSKTDGVVIDRELESYKDALMALKPGDKVRAQVIVAENDRGQSVLSLRRSIFEKRWVSLDEALKEEKSLEVIVKEPVRGGVLVDFGGLRGYIPQSQIDTTLAKQLDKSVGKKIEAKVIEVDRDTNRLIFSQRAISEAAMLAKQKDLLSLVSVGDEVKATITGVVPFGAFAKFVVKKDSKEHEIEGLIHISEIAWEKVEDPNQYMKTGDTIKVKVIGVDMETGKLTLSLKQLLPDPWENVADIFKKDTQVKGKVTRVTPYGVFVSLSPGIEGLIHISKISPGEESKVGDEIDCNIEDVLSEKRKISLSMTLKEKPIGYR
ncbi:30S ribosomal protein S1 [Patescibacteria group bacterium]